MLRLEGVGSATAFAALVTLVVELPRPIAAVVASHRFHATVMVLECILKGIDGGATAA